MNPVLCLVKKGARFKLPTADKIDNTLSSDREFILIPTMIVTDKLV